MTEDKYIKMIMLKERISHVERVIDFLTKLKDELAIRNEIAIMFDVLIKQHDELENIYMGG